MLRLCKQYRLQSRSVEALTGIDFDIQTGEFLCIVGPSGCGKTTLLRILAGLDVQTEGTCDVFRDTSAVVRRPRPLSSMVFQGHSIFPWLSVRDNVAFGLKAQGVGRRERLELVAPYIRTVGLTAFEDALPYQLSGGMQQRVALARAFATDPEMLLMDEPFAALDEQMKLILQTELLRIWEDSAKTVIYVTHSIDEALVLGHRILVLTARPGRVKDIVDVNAAFGRPRSVEAVRMNPRYGELFGHVWGQLRDEVSMAQTTMLSQQS
jgi:NitT/TauT family transport system ATP-binding protein